MKKITAILLAGAMMTGCRKKETPGLNQYVVNDYAFELTSSGTSRQPKTGWNQLAIGDVSNKIFTASFTTAQKAKVYAVGANLPVWTLDNYIVYLKEANTGEYLIYDSMPATNTVTGWRYRDVSAQGKEATIYPDHQYTAGIILKPNPNQPRTQFYTVGKNNNQLPIVPFTQGIITYWGTFDGGTASPAYRLDGVVDIGLYPLTP
jgi:hypothetical protein